MAAAGAAIIRRKRDPLGSISSSAAEQPNVAAGELQLVRTLAPRRSRPRRGPRTRRAWETAPSATLLESLHAAEDVDALPFQAARLVLLDPAVVLRQEQRLG